MSTPPPIAGSPGVPLSRRGGRLARGLAGVRESLRLALDSVRAHPLRSSLTLLGILIGVFSIILVATTVRALQSTVEREMAQLGSHTFQVQRFPMLPVEDDEEAGDRYWRRKRFYLDTARALEERATLAANVGVSADVDRGEMSSRFARTAPTTGFIGLSAGAFATRNLEVAEGRPLVEADMEATRHVAVIGADVRDTLFPYGSALGEWVRFKGRSYTVVGVLEPKGSLFGRSQDNFIAVPIRTVIQQYGRETSLSLQVQAPDRESYEAVQEQARGILRLLRRVPPGAPDDFEIISNESLIRQFRTFTLAVRAGAAVISSIALLAAGIGIMNIMLVSVTERTREIGIRRAVGARKSGILMQFLMEAVVLCQLGGLIGVALGVGVGNLAGMLLQVRAVMPWDWVGIGLAVCSAVGVLFGTYPAWKAANLDPIESLRYE